MKLFDWWRALKAHPVYLRERGQWGKSNPYYETLRRFSPLVILGVLLFGACGGSASPTLLAGGDELAIFWCMLCLPGILLSALTLFGLLMVPALTAPTISLERNNQTWEILRATPLPLPTLLLAKMFGGLARLRAYWWLMFVVSLFYSLMLMASTLFVGQEMALSGLLLGLATLIRPWLEILFAALVGMLMSLWASSSTSALIGSYGVIVAFKLCNSSFLWTALSLGLSEIADLSLLAGTLLPTLTYTLAAAAAGALLMRRARAIEL